MRARTQDRFIVLSAVGCMVSVFVGCGGTSTVNPAPPNASAPVSVSVPASAAVPVPVALSASASVPPPASASASASAFVSAPAPPPAKVVPFPPARFHGAYPRTEKPDDGVWTAMPEGADANSPVMYRSVVHPHPTKGSVYVTVVAIDSRRVDLHLVAGTLEPESKTVPKERRPGLIPAADQDSLFVVFNGGFMARHGHYGMMIDGDTFLPPKPEVCTVALYRDRSIRVQTFSALEASLGTAVAYRQTPPCLLEKGVPNADLESQVRPRKWGAAENGDTEIRRSALGLDASGTILFYGLGEGTTPKSLADAMQAAGAVDAAQLDINWSYTRFLLYGRPSGGAPGAPPEITSTLIPKIKHTKKGYVTSPSERDFFYMTRAKEPPKGR